MPTFFNQSNPIGYSRYKMVLDSHGMPKDAIFLEVNGAFETYFGLSKKDLIGESKMEVFKEFYLNREEEWLQKYFNVAHNDDSFTVNVAYSGVRFELNAYSPLEGDFIILFQDIGQREQEQKMYSDILLEINDAVFITDLAGKFKFVGPNANTIFGMSAEEVTSLEIIDHLIGSDYQSHLEAYSQGDLVKNLEKTIVDKSGQIRNLYIDIKGVNIAGGDLLFVCRDVTERFKAIKYARDEKEKLKTIINTIPDLVWIKDPEGKYITCNKEFEKLYGAPEEEIRGKKDIDFVSREKADLFRKYDLKAMNLGASKNEQTVIYKDGGAVIDVESYKTPLYDADKNLVGVLGVSRDITERNLIRKQLQESKQKYEDLINTVNGIIWEADPKTFEHLYVSKKVEEILGYTQKEWLSCAVFWENRIYKEDREETVRLCYGYDNPARARRYQFRFYKKDGSIVWLKEYVTPITNEKGDVIKLSGLTVDITDQILNRTQLEKYQKFFQLAQDHLCIANKEGYFLEVNDQFTKTLGYSRQQLLEKPFLDLVHSEDLDKTLKGIEQSAKGIPSISFRNRFYTQSGDVRHFQWNATPDGEVIYAVARDITEEVIANNRFKEVIKQAPFGIALVSSEGLPYLVNDALVEMLGYSREELAGLRFTHFSSADEVDSDMELHHKIWNGEIEKFSIEKQIFRKDGSSMPIKLTVTLIADEFADSGKRALAIMQDLTAIKQAEGREEMYRAELELKNKRLNEAQRTAKIGSWTVDYLANKLEWSDEMYRIFEEDPATFLPSIEAFYQLIHPEERWEVKKYFDVCRAKGLPYHLVHRVITRKGTIKYLDVNASFEYDGEHIVQVVGAAQDVTEKELINRELKLRDENLNKFFESVHVGIAKNAMDGKFLEVNPEFERFTGYSKEELNCLSCSELTPKQYDAAEKARLEQLDKTGRYGPYQKHYRTKSGELVPVLLNGVKTYDHKGNEFIWSVVQDITESDRYKNQLSQDIQKLVNILETGRMLSLEMDLVTGEVKTIRDRNRLRRHFRFFDQVDTMSDFFRKIRRIQRKSCERKMESLKAGTVDRYSCELQLGQRGIYEWYEGLVSVLEVGIDGQPSKAFVTLRNIEDEKNKEKWELANQQKERARISRDIHDSIGQMLVGTRMLLSANQDDIQKVVPELDSMLNMMIQESRLIINNFAINVNNDETFRETFYNLTIKMDRVYQGEISISWQGSDRLGDFKVAMHIFRIYQEALSNAIKYSESDLIRVNIRNYDYFFMDVIDYGVGFDKRKEAAGFGTDNMRERARQIGAKVSVDSVKGRGTVVSLRFLY